ncbi:FbpB family small basic protein [Sporosarcina globispora]|nr:FbpB family small basic protein [Sporosarcina globispora]
MMSFLIEKLVAENRKKILKDKDFLEEIYWKVDENILMEPKKHR